jgi:hypothetical protein
MRSRPTNDKRERRTLAEEEFFGAEFFDGVVGFGGCSNSKFLGGFAHVGCGCGDGGVEFGLGGESGCLRRRWLKGSRQLWWRGPGGRPFDFGAEAPALGMTGFVGWRE